MEAIAKGEEVCVFCVCACMCDVCYAMIINFFDYLVYEGFPNRAEALWSGGSPCAAEIFFLPVYILQRWPDS